MLCRKIKGKMPSSIKEYQNDRVRFLSESILSNFSFDKQRIAARIVIL